MLADYQLARFTAFAHPNADVQGDGYNVAQAHIAIANGGLFGTRAVPRPADQRRLRPRAADRLRLLGRGRGVRPRRGGRRSSCCSGCCAGAACASPAQADAAGRLVAAGVVCWIAFQSFQNIGMNLGLTPVTGVPLPFVSYGGSSMFAQALALGLLQAVHRRSVA